MKKIKSTEGDVFLIPLRDGSGFGVGLLARKQGSGGLGYFFKKKYRDEKTFSWENLPMNDIIFIKLFGTPGLDKGSWPILGKLPGWNREKWKVPIFYQQDSLMENVYYALYHSDKLEEYKAREVIDASEATQMPKGGWAGYGFVELVLTDFLEGVKAD